MALIRLLMLVAGCWLALGAAEAAAPAVLTRLTGSQESAFRAAAAPAVAGKRDPKREKALADVQAWPPLGKDAAAQLRKLVASKWNVVPPTDGWKGNPGKAGGMRVIEVPGLGSREYWLAIPDGYSPQHNWPLAISLHGAGGEGHGDFEWLWATWENKQWPGFVASPSGQPAGAQWFPDQRPFVLAVLDDVRKHFAIDDDRVALHGFSNGGNGAWWYGMHYPSLWSAVFERGGGAYDQDLYGNFLHLPITVVHGSDDKTIPCEHDRTSAAKLKELGAPVVYKEMPGSHQPFHEQVNTEVLTWMAKQKRDPWLHSFSLRSHGAEEHRAYWVEMSARGADAEVKAEVTGQSIALTTTGCTELRVWLSDALVDLEQPVTVTWNGKTVHEGKVDRRAGDLLAWLEATGDRAAGALATVELKQ